MKQRSRPTWIHGIVAAILLLVALLLIAIIFNLAAGVESDGSPEVRWMFVTAQGLAAPGRQG